MLHWIVGQGSYKRFVANWVAKIQAHPTISWRHVLTKDNPADVASRGGLVNTLWLTGPEWLQENPLTQPTDETDSEAQVVREVAYVVKSADPEKDEFDSLLERSTLHRTLRVLAWINRFIHNSRGHEKLSGPLDTEEIEAIKFWWIKRIQKRDPSNLHYEEISRQLGLQADERGVAVCVGRIRGSNPIYLPRDAEFAEKLVQRIHCKTLHGGIGLTMAAVRQRYCVPRLRSLVKLVRKKCWGCKRFQQRRQDITGYSFRSDWRRLRRVKQS